MQHLVEGWTERVRSQLLVDGVPLDLTAFAGDDPPAAVELHLFGRDGKAVDFDGTTGVEADQAAQGVVFFDPAADDLKSSLSPYMARWKVTDSFNKVVFFPNEDADVWIVDSVSGA